MRKIFKTKIFVVLVSCLLMYLVSCSRDAYDKISVRSTDYNLTELSAMPYNHILMDKYGGDEYATYYSYVSKTNEYGDLSEILVINNNRPSHVQMINSISGFWVGFDYSEFASGIYFIPCSGSVSKAELLLNSRCVGLFGSDTSEYCYAITSWNFYDSEAEGISLYKLISPTHEKKGYCEQICEVAMDSAIATVQAKNDTFLIASYSSLYSITVEGIVSEIDVPTEWCDVCVNSMVEVDGLIYIGSKYGVYEYDMQKNTFTWFPVDYEVAIK